MTSKKVLRKRLKRARSEVTFLYDAYQDLGVEWHESLTTLEERIVELATENDTLRAPKKEENCGPDHATE